MHAIIIHLTLIGLIRASGSMEQGPMKGFLDIANFDQCEGKDPANYTFIEAYQFNSNCDQTPFVINGVNLIADSGKGKSVIGLEVLAVSSYHAGAYFLYEVLYLCKSGSLEGKFAYIQQIGLLENYLKKCSSVLGYSYIMNTSFVLLIAEKLDISVLFNPGGVFSQFKKTASTVCSGPSYIV